MQPASGNNRGQWGSSFGFVLAGAGSAIGLGNIWRFPYVTGTQGGGAFVLLYLICIAAICLPYLFAELALGRATGRSPVGAFKVLKQSRFWPAVGGLGVLTAIFILSYYSVIAGWTVGYMVKPFVAPEQELSEFASNAWVTVPLMALFLGLTAAVVVGGIEHGIEKWSRILMPALLVLILVVTVRGLTLDGAGAGVEFLLKPDFSKMTSETLVAALGQAFYSLSLGMGAMTTYGSYLSKDSDLQRAGTTVAIFDTGIALLAGLMIFPALFALGGEAGGGPALIFNVLPELFGQMPLGQVFEPLFFLLLAIAALSSTVSVLEVGVAFCIDELHWSRKRAVWLLTALVFVVALPSALSQGAVDILSNLTLFGAEGFLGVMDFLWGNVSLPLGAMLTCIFVGWVWGAGPATRELAQGSRHPDPGIQIWGIFLPWRIFLRWICPVCILTILLRALLPGGAA